MKGLVKSSVKVPEFNIKAPEFDKKHLKKAKGHIDQNIVYITIETRIIVWIF